MSADLRGFEYPLEPVRQKREWRLEASKAALRSLDAELRRASATLARLREVHELQRRHAAQALLAGADPAHHRRNLDWLVAHRGSIARAEEVVATLDRDRRAQVERCASDQRSLEALERDRERCIAEFLQGAEARVSCEADRDWLARTGSRAGLLHGQRAGKGSR